MKLRMFLWALRLRLLFIATIVFCPSVSFSQDFSGIAGALIGAAMSQRPPIVYYQPRQATEPRIRSRGKRNPDHQNESQLTAENKSETARQQHDAFLKIAPAVKELIEDASIFVKENPANPKAIAFVKKINQLNSALATENIEKLKPLMEALAGDLRHEPGYEKLETARNIQKREEAARYLPELVRVAKQQQAYIRYYITNNTTAQYTATFIQLLDDLDTAITSPDLEKLKALTSRVDVSIREAHLQDDFVQSRNVLAQSPPNSGSARPADQPSDASILRKTEKNGFIIDGDPRELVLLYNTSPQAPHVTRNLNGTIAFENNEARACLYEPNFSQTEYRLMKQRLLSEYKIPKPDIDSGECSRNTLVTYDVIAFERGHLSQMPPQHKIGLYSELEANHFKHLKTVRVDQLDAIVADEKKVHDKILADIESASGEGYGIVELSPAQVTTVCMVIKDSESAHRQLLQESVELSTSDIIFKPTLDVAYKALQRNECQGIYAVSLDLKTLTEALAKSSTNYIVAPVWNRKEEIQAAEKLVQAKNDAETKRELIARTQREAQEHLRRTMNAEENGKATVRQAALQTEFGKPAAAYADGIAKDIRVSLDTRDDWQQTSAYAQFPKFVTWYQNMVRNHWELQSFNSYVLDYGHAEWKGRTMETGFTALKIRLRNRILGEYKEVCGVFGRMTDTEFSMVRDPTEFSCDQTAELSSLNKARNFESQWLVQPQS